MEKPHRYNRNNSLQIDNKVDHQPNVKFASIVESALRHFNEAHPDYKWDMERLEEKRRLQGLKLKVRWRDLVKKYTALVKLCVPGNFDNIRATRNFDSDDFILELESINFHMEPRQQKAFQSFLDAQMRSQIKAIATKGSNEDDWLKHILEALSERLADEDKSEFHDKRQILKEEPIVKCQVNENYIICPSPIAIAWSPQGQLTISEHRTIPRVKGAYIGNRRFLNFAFDNSKSPATAVISKEENDLFEQLIPELSTDEESMHVSIYDWKTEENLDFMDKSVTRVESTVVPNTFEDDSRKSVSQKKIRATESKKSDAVMLADLSKTSPELSKFYKAHFSKAPAAEHQQHNEKIRTYRIEGPDKELENELMFLLYRISEGKERNVIESVLKTELAGYMKIFEQGQQHYDALQYRLICRLLT